MPWDHDDGPPPPQRSAAETVRELRSMDEAAAVALYEKIVRSIDDAVTLLSEDAAAEIERLRGLLNAPELYDFGNGVVREAAHQRDRWGATHDAEKQPEDWFWLVGYLTGKALHAVKAGDTDKGLHHCISTAAVLANWHAVISGAQPTENRATGAIPAQVGEEP